VLIVFLLGLLQLVPPLPPTPVVTPPALATPRRPKPVPTWDSCWQLDGLCADAPDHFRSKVCRRARRCFEQLEAL